MEPDKKRVCIRTDPQPIWKQVCDAYEGGDLETAHNLLRSMDHESCDAVVNDWISDEQTKHSLEHRRTVVSMMRMDDLDGFKILLRLLKTHPLWSCDVVIDTCVRWLQKGMIACPKRIARYLFNHYLPAANHACFASGTGLDIAVITDNVYLLRQYLTQTKQSTEKESVDVLATAYGAIKIVQYCIEELGIHPEKSDVYRPPLFYLAVKYDRLLVAQWLYYETQCDIALGPWGTDEPPIFVASPRCKRWILTLPQCHKHYDYGVIESNMFTTLGTLVFGDRQMFPDPSHFDLSGMNLGNSAIKLLCQALPLWDLYSPITIDISNNPRIGHSAIKKLVRTFGRCSCDMEIKLVVGNQLPPNILNLLIKEAIESANDYEGAYACFKLDWQVPTLYTIALHSVHDMFMRKRSHEKRYKACLPQEVWERLQELVKPS